MRSAIMVGLATLAWGCQSGSGSPDGESGNDDAKLTADRPAARCGMTECGAGEVCCNASCGICTPAGGSCIQLACEPGNAGGSCASTTCLTGTTCMETRGGPQCVAPEADPCRKLDCPPNATCSVVQGAATCVPVPSGSADASVPSGDAGPRVTPGSCALALCPGLCRDVPGGFSCEPVKDAGSVKPPACAAALCPTGTYCDDSSGEAQCIKAPSCSTTRCEAGQHCELQEVQCIRAPCPPQPTCVPDAETNPCATVRCAAGTHCEAKQVQCIRAPCPPIAQCVPDAAGGTQCGANICAAGTTCCNASCGICAPKGGACIQIACP